MAEKRALWPYLVGGLLGAGALWLTWSYRRSMHALSGLGGATGPIKTIQLDLRKIGIPVQATGTLDDATVTAINQIFNGSVDVPAKLATGNLTKHDIAANIGAVSRALKVVVHGAQNFEDVSSG